MPPRRDKDELIPESTVEYFAKSRREWNAPAPPPEAEEVAALNWSVELQHAAATAAEAASQRAGDADLRDRLTALSRCHAILARELSHVVHEHGGAAPTFEESRGQLPADENTFAYAPDDNALRRGMLEDLRFLERAYREAGAWARLPEEVRRRFQELADIHHRAAEELTPER